MTIERWESSRDALLGVTEKLLRLMKRRCDNGNFHLALSGGETAKRMFSLWVKGYRERIDWSKIHFYWVDERCVPPTDPESNYGEAKRLLFDPLQIPEQQIHRIRGEEEPGVEARRYAAVVKELLPRYEGLPAFDAIILGVGTDFHTASIFPHTMELLHEERYYAVSTHPSGQLRVTMTGPLLLNHVPLLVPLLGSEKQELLRGLERGYSRDNATPASYILSLADKAMLFAATTDE
ncbi:6-phosphogluconolactonase [Parabacteroides sp. OttesenSCG-928-N08]|nr:6-phosphogluconolactonase [Parabacteroides sp. OttesenSCG-928-N08]